MASTSSGEGLDSHASLYYELVRSLLGSPSQGEPSRVLPAEVKYVLLALSSKNGPLEGLLVASGLLTEGASAPVRLSLLPRASVWANHAIEACAGDAVTPARLAEASKSTRFLDLKPATDASCGAFLSVATPLSATTAVAVVLGFKERTACTPAAIRAAKTLLHMASTRCRDSVVNILAVTEMLVAPPPLPQLRHPDGAGLEDEDDEEFVEEEWELPGGRTGGGEPPPLRNPAHPLTLRFPRPDMEAAFAAWNNQTLTRMDAFGFAMCGCSLLFILFIPHTAWDRAFRAADIAPWRGVLALLPAALIVSPRTRAFYSRHREAIVAYVFACVLQWTLHVAHYMHCMEPAAFTRPLYLHGFSWVGVLALLFQVRFRLLAPLVLACFAADAAAMMPDICATFYPTTPALACVGLDVARVGLLAVAGPLTLARLMELRARELFLARLQRE